MRPNLKLALIAFFIVLTSFNASARQENGGQEQIQVIAPDTSGIRFYTFASWHINEFWMVEAAHECKQEKLWGWWPLDPKCQGRLWLELNDRGPNGELISERFLLKRSWKFGGGPKHTLSVDGKTGSDTELFDLLLKKESPILKVDDLEVELQSFSELSNENYKFRMQQFDEPVANERKEIIFSTAGFIVFLLAIGFALRWVVRKAPSVVKGMAKGVRAATDEVEKINVRRVARDEVIRQATREVLSEESEKEKEVIRNQIKQALANGNHELAETLQSVLKKLDNG